MTARREISSRNFERYFLHFHRNVRPMTVRGDVVLAAERFPRGVRLSHVAFLGSVTFAGAAISGGVSISHCDFRAGLDLSHVDVAGDLEIKETSAESIKLSDGKVAGNCHLYGLTIRPAPGKHDAVALDLASLSVGALRIDRVPQDGFAKLREAKSSMEWGGALMATAMKCHQDVDISALSLTALDLSGVNARAMTLSGVRMARPKNVHRRPLDEELRAATGQVSMQGVRCKLTLRLKNLVAESLNLSGGKATDIYVNNVHIRGAATHGVTLRLDRVQAAVVQCLHVTVTPDDAGPDGAVSEVSAIGLDCYGLSLNWVQTDVLRIRSSRLHFVVLQHVRIAKDVEIAASRIGMVRFEPPGRDEASDAAGTSSPSRSHEATKQLDGVVIERNFNIWSCDIGTQLDCTASTIKGRVWIIQSTIGDLVLLGSIKDGPPSFSDTTAQCEIKLPTVRRQRIGAIVMHEVTIKRRCLIAETEIGMLSAGAFDGRLEMVGCRVGHDLWLWRPDRIDDASGVDGVAPVGIAIADARCTIHGAATIKNCSIGGDLVLVGTLVEPGDLSIIRRIGEHQPATMVLDGTTVEGRLRTTWDGGTEASGFLTELPRLSVGALHMNGLKAREIVLTCLEVRQPVSELPALKPDVEANDIVVRGEFRLFQNDAWHARIAGALSLRSARIDHLIVSADTCNGEAPSPATKGTPPAKTARNCGLVLAEAKIGHLRMPHRQPCEIAGTCNGYPVPLDLSNCEIGLWSFTTDDDETPESDDIVIAERYLNALDNDESFSRGVYRSVAKRLREEGRTNAALRVYCAERYRAFWEHRRGWKRGEGRLGNWARPVREGFSRVGHWGYRHFLRYGASPLPLVAVIFGLAVASTALVTAEPRNFELSTPNRMLIAAQQQSANSAPREARDSAMPRIDADTRPCMDRWGVLSPAADKWSYGDIAWMTVRYHIPIVSVFARDDVVPTDDRGITLSIERWFVAPPAWGCVAPNPGNEATGSAAAAPMQTGAGWSDRVPISPEGWFQFVAILNWIMWPLLLTALLRRLVIEER